MFPRIEVPKSALLFLLRFLQFSPHHGYVILFYSNNKSFIRCLRPYTFLLLPAVAQSLSLLSDELSDEEEPLFL